MPVPAGGDDKIERIKLANDLVGVMQEYVQLQRSGRNYKVCCPFHESKRGGRERTPSLYVYTDRTPQTWKCFAAGCGRGGTVVDFVMEAEGLDVKEALKMLGERAGIPFESKPKPARAQGEVEEEGIFDLLKEAQQRFASNYSGSEADRYVDGRGITRKTAEAYGLGYARDAWDDLKTWLGRKWKEPALLQAGLIRESETPDRANPNNRRTYDFFRRRLTIPIRDQRGRILGFGARALAPDEKAKYINSPQTEVYNKSAVLFGIDLAKEAIRTSRRAIVMEGYTDVMLAWQHGIENCVAPCGTALTEGHLPLLRQADTLTLLFDGDIPGMRAAERSLHLMVAHDLRAEVVVLPDDLDPADYLLKHGGDAFREFLGERAQDPVAFKMTAVKSRYDLADGPGLQKAVGECLDMAAESPSPVMVEYLLKRFATGLGMEYGTVRAEFERTQAARRSIGGASATSARSNAGATTNTESGPRAGSDRYRGGSNGGGGGSDRRASGSRGSGKRSRGGYGKRGGDRGRYWDDDKPSLPEMVDIRLSDSAVQEIALACVLAEPSLHGAFDRTFGILSLPEGPLREAADWILRLAPTVAPAFGAGPDDPPAVMRERLTDTLSGDQLAALDQLRDKYIGPHGTIRMSAITGSADEVEEQALGGAMGVEDVFTACIRQQEARRAHTESRKLRLSTEPSEAEAAPLDKLERARRHLELQRARRSAAQPLPEE